MQIAEMIVLIILAIMGGLILFLQAAFLYFLFGAERWELEL